MKKNLTNLFNSKVNLFILLAFIGIIIIVILDLFDEQFNYHDILVEFHGLIYDLFVFGIVLTIYESNREKKRERERLAKDIQEKIERYQEEINDFRFWHSEEAKFRISGLVKRLVNLGVKKVKLSHCFLKNANGVTSIENMQEWDFSAANLNDTTWIMNDCSDSLFYLTQLHQSSFRNVNLTNCKFDSAILYETQFRGCNFSGVSLKDAVVHTKDWFEEMKLNENGGVEELMKKYKIYEIPQLRSEIQGYKIISK